MNFPRRRMYWQIKRLYWEEMRRESNRVSELRCRVAHRLRLYSNEVSFWIVYGQSSCLVHIWSDLVTFRVVHASLSQDGFHWEGFWEGSHLHLATPKFSWLLFDCSTMLFIGTSSCETTHASGYHCFRQQFWSKVPQQKEKNVYEKIK